MSYSYTSPGHVRGSIQILNTPASLVYGSPFVGIDATMTGAQTAMEGLWWRRDPGVGGFVALNNPTEASVDVTLQAIGSQGTALPAQSLTLLAHTTQMLRLDSLLEDLPLTENEQGGLRILYSGNMDSILVSGGLTNESEGYSADIPFWFHDLGSSAPVAINYASVGLMIGHPDPMLGFPRAVRFTPYITLRNTTANPLPLTATLNYMAGTTPTNLAIPLQPLKPFEARQVHVQPILASLGLEDLSGNINLSFSFKGHGGDLVLATGSVDETGNYVFSVEPQGVGPSVSKTGGLWTVANGFDTMFSLWNPTSQAEDFLLTFYYGDGSGSYLFPVHLEAQASTMIDMKVLIGSGQPDANGNTIPPSIQQGSLVVASAKGKTEWMTVVASAGGYNPQVGTCGPPPVYCVTCDGYTAFDVTPAAYPVGSSAQATAQGSYQDGTIHNLNSNSQWSSSATSVATVGSTTGVVYGVSPGTFNLDDTFQFLEPLAVPNLCSQYGYPVCPTIASFGSGGSVTPTVTVSCSPADLALGPTAPKNTTIANCNTSASPAGGSFSWSVNTNTVTVNSSGGGATITAANKSGTQGDTVVSVTYTYNAESATAQSSPLTVHNPTSLKLVSDTTGLNGCFVPCLASPGDGTCNTNSNACTYNYNRRIRTYSVLDQFGVEFQNVGISSVTDVESGTVTTTCPDVSINTGGASTSVFSDTFQLCSSCCLPGGPGCTAQWSPNQTISVNGISVNTESISFTCSGVTVTP